MKPVAHHSRRHFLKMIGTGASCLTASSAFPLLTACSSNILSSQSYIHHLMPPSKNTTVFHWTDIMLQAVRNNKFTPPQATRAFAMGHLAGFLAVNGIKKKYHTRYNTNDGPTDADLYAAYGTAVSKTISDAFQAPFIFDLNKFLDLFPDGDSKDRAVEYGSYIASKVIRYRAKDGAEPSRANYYLGRYPRRDDVLQWAPTGPFYSTEPGPEFKTFGRGLYPGWGAQKPWIIQSPSLYMAAEFPDPRSPEYARQYLKVRELGGKDSKIRTPEQTQIAFFWEDGPWGISPPGHFQLIAINILQNFNLDIVEQARIFAMLSMAQADAAIATWHNKYEHDILRPETAIRQRTAKFENEMLKGQRQADWQSLIFSPSFPAYTSGHSAFAASSARMLALCIGRDDIHFTAKAPDMVNWPTELAGISRSWTSLWQAALENGASREYGGVHWESDNVEGLRIGREIADYVFTHAFGRAV